MVEIKLENIKLVIFDLDGLLIDSERISINSWIKAFGYYNYKLNFNTALQRIGCSSSNTERFYVEKMGEDLPYAEIKKLHYKFFVNSINEDENLLKKGSINILNYLESMGIKKALASSSYKCRVMESLKAANLLDSFDIIICGDDVSKCKPDPEMHFKICKELGIDTNEAIILEDSDIGAKAAFNAGIKCIMIPDLKEIPSECFNSCYTVVETLDDVIDLLEMGNRKNLEEAK